MARFIMSIAVICVTAAAALAQEPIAELDLLPDHSRLQASAWNKPIVMTSMQEAGRLFKNAAPGALGRQVDFSKQFLLVFAWQGSGGDRLGYAVAESFPEQVFFSLKRGLTRDLRQHAHVYALRSNVTWSIQEKDAGLNGSARELPGPGRPCMENAERTAAGAEP